MIAVAVPTGSLQPVGLVQDLVALGPACCSAASKKRTLKNCANSTEPPQDRGSRARQFQGGFGDAQPRFAASCWMRKARRAAGARARADVGGTSKVPRIAI